MLAKDPGAGAAEGEPLNTERGQKFSGIEESGAKGLPGERGLVASDRYEGRWIRRKEIPRGKAGEADPYREPDPTAHPNGAAPHCPNKGAEGVCGEVPLREQPCPENETSAFSNITVRNVVVAKAVYAFTFVGDTIAHHGSRPTITGVTLENVTVREYQHKGECTHASIEVKGTLSPTPKADDDTCTISRGV